MKEIVRAIAEKGPRDPLPPNTPWWGVIIARIATTMAKVAAVATVAFVVRHWF